MRVRKSGFLAMNEQGAVTYHCVSRVVDRDYKFGDKEKAVFVKMMRQYEQFCGVEVLSYCVMSNHFHLLVRVCLRFLRRNSRIRSLSADSRLFISLWRCVR